MDSAKPRLYGLIKYRGESSEGSRGAQEPLDQRGINPMAKIASPPLYIEGKPVFWRHPSIVTKILLLGIHQGGGEPSQHQHQHQGRRRGKGTLPPRAAAPPGAAATEVLPPGAATSRGRRHGDLHRHLLHGLHRFINFYINIFVYPFVISWQT